MKVQGILNTVQPTQGVVVIGGRAYRFLDQNYWTRGSAMRAFEALVRLKEKQGREVVAEVDEHAGEPAIFGRRAIQIVPKSAAKNGARKRNPAFSIMHANGALTSRW